MGTILASVITGNAGEILHDTAGKRWTATEKLKWLNAGLRQLCVLRPQACVLAAVVQLVAGTKQSLPAGALALLDVNRNMGAAGNAPGRAPRFIEKKVIDLENPLWHKDAPGAEVLHWVYDQRDPKVFWVYPPQPTTGQGQLDISHTASPAAITAGDAIPVDDVFAEALTDYVVARCYAKDPANMDKATTYMQSFMTAILGKTKMDSDVAAALSQEA